ncbi:MAG: helix-turn-helix domain-containing protein, partial [Nitrosospira sp.]
TPKEVQVMRLLANWMTREQISQELGIVPPTVNCHCNNIMWKLDLNSTPELYKEATRRYGESR